MTKNLVPISLETAHLIKDDPVRPELSFEFRLTNGRECFVLMDSDIPVAVICVAYTNRVPITVEDLDTYIFNDFNSIAVFYTVWSYQKGAGREILFNAVELLKQSKPSVKRFVTLSPKTEMARKFHLSNGAVILSENQKTDNYEYIIG